ncbi:hypothetical protein ACIOEX_11185 [Streptomyces sp. NPDC087850]|uniref:hypothetical protein n=1 Tax=Streptomyces sp. NPDC087850 TaxID=3365809 RepID=UPI003829C4FF
MNAITTTTYTGPTLLRAEVTVTTDATGRVYAIIPDDVARPLAAASTEGYDPAARGIYFESVPHAAGSWVAATVRVIFGAVLDAMPDRRGLRDYSQRDGGDFYGVIAGESAWDAEARCWERGEHNDLIVTGNASIAWGRGPLAGTCIFHF